jgi:hypothetical protein
MTSVSRRSSLDLAAELAPYRFGTPAPLTNLAHGQVRIPAARASLSLDLGWPSASPPGQI